MDGGDRHGRWLALATVLLGAAWFVAVLSVMRDAPLPPDAASYGVIARNLARGDGYTESFVPFHPGPYASVRHLPDLHGLLTPVLLAPLFAWQGGASAAALRVPATLAVPGIALVVFALARRLFGATPAFLAALLVLASPSLVFYATLATDDTGFTLLATAVVALLAVAMHERRPSLLVAAGLVMGVAILEKPTGVFLPALGLIALLGLRRNTHVSAGAVLGLLVPPALAFGVYVLRNQLAHGSPDFRFGGLEWIWKDSGFEGMMALYERTPSTLETVRRLGLARVLQITSSQFEEFVRTTFQLRPVLAASSRDLGTVAVPAFLPALTLLLLPWLARRTPPVVALVVGGFLAMPLVICTLWHPEPRYFALFIPFAALALAGTVGGSAAGRAAMVGLVLVSAVGAVSVARAFTRNPDYSCAPLLRRLAATQRPGPILTLDPWRTAWLADREAIMIPSGDLDAIATVARRYDARLMLVHPMLGRGKTLALLANLEGTSGPLRVTTIARNGGCRLAKLDVLGDAPR